MAHTQHDNALMAHQGAMSGCTFSGGAVDAGNPFTNLLKLQPAQACILTDLEDARIRCSLVGTPLVRFVWVGFASVTGAATFRVRLALSAAAMDLDDTLYDSRVGSEDLPCTDGELPLPHRKNRRHFFVLLPAAIAAGCVDVEIFDPDNPAGEIIVSSLVIANPFQPATNVGWGAAPPWPTDPSEQTEAKTGEKPSLPRAPYDVSEYRLPWSNEDEVIGSLRDFVEAVMTTRAVVMIMKPRNPKYVERYTIYGKFQALNPVTLPNFGIYDIPFRIGELTP